MPKRPVTDETVSWVRSELLKFAPEVGLSFLEFLAHNLTIAVRIAADRRIPHGELSAEEARNAMYWTNEAIHDVVQRTRELRIQQRQWDAEDITEWITMWLGYEHAAEFIEHAVERSFRDIERPCIQHPSA
jgi:hypothetical protein